MADAQQNVSFLGVIDLMVIAKSTLNLARKRLKPQTKPKPKTQNNKVVYI